MSKRKKGFRFAIRGRHFTLGFPFLWLTLFFALPFAIVLKISFSTAAIAIPPYEPTDRKSVV